MPETVKPVGPLRVGATALVIAIAALTLGLGGALPAQEAAPEETLRPVRLLVVDPPHNTLQRQFYGQVVARQTVDLAFQVGGQLNALPVMNGQTVSEGDLLAQLDLEPFDRAVSRAELNLTQAQRDFDRVQQLAQSNVASEARFDEAQTALDLAKLGLREARDARDDATLSAAFDGLVAQRLVANYSTVAQGTPVLRLHDMSQPRIEIDVPERLFRSAGRLEGLEFTADLGDGMAGIPLRVAEYTAETRGVSQSYAVDLALPPVEGYTPLPGRTATVTATLPSGSSDALVIPVTALVHTADRSTEVMIYEPVGADTGTVRALPVTVVSREGADLGIKPGEALQPGMEIVSTGAHLLTDGMQVRRFTGFRESD
ncbi:efflux RND transporter periplasmic adaptor subunit [Meridianimarinicoccus roseus]|uniref:Efflux RND transporter periplasmic adaptor subunit n=1 Tax=Meridianimarinicoccus roseus TaxID=2072018 RepID=A0A2V2LGX9_9RHOB|nr:efflux RND transporter periplasmic adaptor subunit [Meridianimarinicoccus roseus]PWR02506.1 efflux RND transporter periplasmic adaptor subunit [Meridianimarinicoccus roseus]